MEDFLIGLLVLVAIWYIIKWLNSPTFVGPPRRRVRRIKTRRRGPKAKEIKLTPSLKAKSDQKYRLIYNRFKKTHKRTPTRSEKYNIVITASHHVLPVKGTNSRPWMRGKRGHWGRQKVRKYLLEKHNIDLNFKMK